MKILETVVKVVLFVIGALVLIFLGWCLRGLKEREGNQ